MCFRRAVVDEPVLHSLFPCCGTLSLRLRLSAADAAVVEARSRVKELEAAVNAAAADLRTMHHDNGMPHYNGCLFLPSHHLGLCCCCSSMLGFFPLPCRAPFQRFHSGFLLCL